MARFRKKPVEIEARLYDGENHQELIEWINGPGAPVMGGKAHLDRASNIWIDDSVNEGAHRVLPGDWVIHGVSGEFYGCKPDIFEATYEEIL